MPRWTEPEQPRIEGDVAYIPLSREGCEAIVDTADLPLVGNRRWSYVPHKSSGPYAIGRWREGDPPELRNKAGNVYMHRLLLNPPPNKWVDHINHNGLDNRRANIRIVSKRDNSFNRKDIGVRNKTGVRGVSIHTGRGGYKMYVARVTVAKYYPLTPEGLEAATREAARLQDLLKAVDLWDPEDDPAGRLPHLPRRPDKITDDDVRAIRRASEGGETQASIAKRFNTGQGYVSMIASRKKRAEVPD